MLIARSSATYVFTHALSRNGAASVPLCPRPTGSCSSRATSPPGASTRSSTRRTRRCSAAAGSTVRSRAGGAAILAECRRLGGCDTGDAKATGAGELPARVVIHTVGPVWRGGGHGEDELLASSHRRSLEVAAERDCRTVAFPAISTGIYGFPIDRAARIAIETTAAELDARPAIEQVIFVLFGRDAYGEFEAALSEL